MARTRSNDQLKNLVDAAGDVICFNKILAHVKQRLEEPVDTPDEVVENLWYAEACKIVLATRRAEYKRLREAFAPDDVVGEALDNLIKECGAEE